MNFLLTGATICAGLSVDPLIPCCLGAANATRSCGDVDLTGRAMFTVCKDPVKSFFWDTIHPSQAGWTAVAKVLFPNATLQPFSSSTEKGDIID